MLGGGNTNHPANHAPSRHNEPELVRSSDGGDTRGASARSPLFCPYPKSRGLGRPCAERGRAPSTTRVNGKSVRPQSPLERRFPSFVLFISRIPAKPSHPPHRDSGDRHHSRSAPSRHPGSGLASRTSVFHTPSFIFLLYHPRPLCGCPPSPCSATATGFVSYKSLLSGTRLTSGLGLGRRSLFSQSNQLPQLARHGLIRRAARP